MSLTKERRKILDSDKVKTKNSEIRRRLLEVDNSPISLNKAFNKLRVELFAFVTTSNTPNCCFMSSSYSTGFWFLLYLIFCELSMLTSLVNLCTPVINASL